MENYFDGLKVSNHTAGLVKAYELALKSYEIVLEVERDFYGGEEGCKTMFETSFDPKFKAYTDAILDELKMAVVMNVTAGEIVEI